MKKLFIVQFILFLLVYWQILYAGTYNFYFYDKEEKKEEMDPPVKPGDDNDLHRDDNDLHRDDNDLHRDDKLRGDDLRSVVLPAPIRQAKNSSLFTLPDDSYFSLGLAYEGYSPKSDFNSYIMNAYSLTFRTKFIPWISFEGAFPLTQFEEDNFNVYRFGILKEFSLFKNISFHIGTGIVFNDQGERDERKRELENNIPYSSEINELLFIARSAVYGGLGLKINLLKHLDLIASANIIPTHISNLRFWHGRPSMRQDSLLSLGAMYVF